MGPNRSPHFSTEAERSGEISREISSAPATTVSAQISSMATKSDNPPRSLYFAALRSGIRGLVPPDGSCS